MRHVEVDRQLLEEICIIEQAAGHKFDSDFWQAVANRYSQQRRVASISWATARNRGEAWGISSGIERRRKGTRGEGRQRLASKTFIQEVLTYLENSAVDDEWQENNVGGWELLNKCRRTLGMQAVKAKRWPTKEDFLTT
jgi:hypothetical protein